METLTRQFGVNHGDSRSNTEAKTTPMKEVGSCGQSQFLLLTDSSLLLCSSSVPLTCWFHEEVPEVQQVARNGTSVCEVTKRFIVSPSTEETPGGWRWRGINPAADLVPFSLSEGGQSIQACCSSTVQLDGHLHKNRSLHTEHLCERVWSSKVTTVPVGQCWSEATCSWRVAQTFVSWPTFSDWVPG